MAYITQADLEKRFANLQWWTDDAAAGSIDASIVTEAIGLAEAEINAAAGQQYTVPLSLGDATTAAVIRDKAGTIAGYKLATRRREMDSAEALRLDFEDVAKWLRDLAAGKVLLAGETTHSQPRPAGGIVVGGSESLVDRDSMDGL